MMRTMRASAKWIMLFLAVAFVGWMVFDVGMDVGGRTGTTTSDAVARVNGAKIDLQTYYNAVRLAQDQQREQFGFVPVTLEQQRALDDAVLENLIQEILLAQEFRKRGIRVTDAEVIERARTSPPPELMSVPNFQTDGQFDFSKYQRYIASNADPNLLLSLEARYREEIPRDKLFNQLTSDVYVSTAELWRMYRDVNDSVSVRVMRLLPDDVPLDSQAVVTDEDAMEYYREHQEDFRRPAVAFTSYVSVSRRTDASDSAAALDRATAVKRELDDGTDFAALAMRESADSASRENGGDLGMTPRGQFIAEFETAALALRPDQISDPVLSAFGYHIIKLESKSRDSLHAHHILIPMELAGDHLDRVDRRADSLDMYIAEQSDPTQLDQWAADLRLPVYTGQPLVQGGQMFLEGNVVPDVSIWAFEALEGETSHVVEAPWAYYVFRVDSLRPEGVPAFEEVQATVRRAATEAKRRAAAREVAEQIAAKLRAGQHIMETALEYELNASTSGPMTRVNPAPEMRDLPEVLGTAFGLGVGQASGPIETDRGIYFVEPVSKQLSDSSAFIVQLASQRFQAMQTAQQERLRQYLLSIRNDADVVDRRRELERLQRELEELAERSPLNPLGF
jgi:peptidyl-prolyl cis-trans isomerase D